MVLVGNKSDLAVQRSVSSFLFCFFAFSRSPRLTGRCFGRGAPDQASDSSRGHGSRRIVGQDGFHGILCSYKREREQDLRGSYRRDREGHEPRTRAREGI